MKIAITFLVAGCAMAAMPSAPLRANGIEPVSTLVHHDDLNLQSQAGVAELERRVARAIRKVCRQSGRSLREIVHENKCRRTASEQATEQVRFATASRSRISTGN
jgi:UrcA family protein